MYLIIPVFAAFLIYVVLLVRKSQLSMKYTYLWVLFSVMSLMPIFLNEEIDRSFLAKITNLEFNNVSKNE